MNQLHYGTVQAVFPPGTPQNLNAYQYEYSVLITGDNYTQVPLQHVLRADDTGHPDNYDDRVLSIGNKVLVACLKDYSQCFIVGAIRNSTTVMDASGPYSLRRYNLVEVLFDQQNNWSVTSDSGPNVQVNTDSVVLGDGVAQTITLDQVNKVLTIDVNDLTIVLTGKADVTVQGDATLDITGDVSLTAGGKVTLECSELDATVDGDATISSKGTVEVDAQSVTLAGEEGMVLTTATWPVDPITGIPTVGSTKVKAGS